MFLTRLLSGCFAAIFEISAWVGLIAGGAIGYVRVDATLPGVAWLGAVLGVLVAFLIEVMVWGIVAMLIDVRNSLRDMARHGTR